MLSKQDNATLTSVGPGTPMGDVLRRYWMPALLSNEMPVPGGDPVRVRLLGENLVAFRDLTGRAGLIQENCPHRGASLYFGRNEAGPGGTCGLRCPYHGWQFDADGRCIDMPSEPPASSFKDRVTAKAYPTHESGGVVWTYMGPPDTMTPFRDFGTESLPGDLVLARKGYSACNWIQSIEANLDSAHISWLHQFNGVDDIPDDGSDKPGYPSNAMSWKFWRHDRSPRIEVHDTWYGFRYGAIRTTPAGHSHVRISAFCYPNATIIAIIPFATRLSMIVPIDDESCWRYGFVTQEMSNPAGYGADPQYAVTPFEVPFLTTNGVQERRYTAENEYLIDREVQRTSTFTGIADFQAQDLMATESMGAIYDRSQENLGTTDRAVIRMRRLLLAAANALRADGTPPPALAVDGNDFRSIRSAEKVLEPGEDWRILGTDDDPYVQEAMMAATERRVPGR